MSRYYDGDEEQYNNQGELWWRNVQRSLQGPKGQAAILDLYHALQALPTHELISGNLYMGGQACAVGALVAYRQAKATDRSVDALLAELDPGRSCTCHHPAGAHAGGTCSLCLERLHRPGRLRPRRQYDTNQRRWVYQPGWDFWVYRPCKCYTPVPPEDEDHDTDYETARAGVAVGTTYTLAWYLGYLNDEEYGRLTPAERWVAMVAWCVAHLAPIPV